MLKWLNSKFNTIQLSQVNTTKDLNDAQILSTFSNKSVRSKSTGSLEFFFQILRTQEEDYELNRNQTTNIESSQVIFSKNHPNDTINTILKSIDTYEQDQYELPYHKAQDTIQDGNTPLSEELLRFESLSNEVDDEDMLCVTKLILQASVQPWIISPNIDNFEVSDEKYNSECINNETKTNTNFLITSTGERFEDKELIDNISKSFNQNNKEIKVDNLQTLDCEYNTQLLYECNLYHSKY